MNPDHQREIRQIFFAADNLLSDINAKISKADQAMKELMKKPMPDFAALFTNKAFAGTDAHKVCVLLGADLASVATRLVTVEERLQSMGYLTDYGAFHDLVDSVKDEGVLVKAFDRQSDRILHLLLRDNVGHIEPTQNGSKSWWKARQVVLSKITLEALHQKIAAIHERIRKQLQDYSII